jgi:L-cysteine S-thiosulfotransferase
MKKLLILLALLPTFSYAQTMQQKADAALEQAFGKATPEWFARVKQDDTMRICTEFKNDVKPDVAKKIMAEAKASIIYPADGIYTGDWKKGEKGALNGVGHRFTDRPGTEVAGGNCYACHQMSPLELSSGTLGAPLTGYGKIKGNTVEAQKELYEKIYNSNSTLACSNMPRFGHNKFLTPEQIKDYVAFLLDPASPVNK